MDIIAHENFLTTKYFQTTVFGNSSGWEQYRGSSNKHPSGYKFKWFPLVWAVHLLFFKSSLSNYIVGDISGVAYYLDDIVVTGRSEHEHLNDLQKTMDKLRPSSKVRKVSILPGQYHIPVSHSRQRWSLITSRQN